MDTLNTNAGINTNAKNTNVNENPCGINGVDFIEYSGGDSKYFENLFNRFGFKEVSQIHGKNIKLFKQGNINFILNCEPNTFATHFSSQHGPCISSTGFFVHNADSAFQTAVSRGAKPYDGNEHEKGATPFPAVYGIGNSLVYFVDEANRQKLYTKIFEIQPADSHLEGFGFTDVDHFTNNVPVGEMQKWCDFYQKIFGFKEVRYFDIRGKSTGLISKVMRSPCGKFSIPINEPTEKASQIQEYLNEYKGSGIQHLALLTKSIIQSLEAMKQNQVEFLSPPPHSYYAMLKDRLPNVTEDLTSLESHAVLADGDDKGYLLQIFTKNVIGPIFYELIQRKNHFGFGEGNFQALFDAMERDQVNRGVLNT